MQITADGGKFKLSMDMPGMLPLAELFAQLALIMKQ